MMSVAGAVGGAAGERREALQQRAAPSPASPSRGRSAPARAAAGGSRCPPSKLQHVDVRLDAARWRAGTAARCRPSLYSSCGGTFEVATSVTPRRNRPCEQTRQDHRIGDVRDEELVEAQRRARVPAMRRATSSRGCSRLLARRELRVHAAHETIEVARARARTNPSEAKNASISRVLPRPTPPHRYRPRGALAAAVAAIARARRASCAARCGRAEPSRQLVEPYGGLLLARGRIRSRRAATSALEARARPTEARCHALAVASMPLYRLW